jgi:hypothetical protein
MKTEGPSLGKKHRAPVIERTSFAHVNKYGKPKVTYMSEATAMASAEERSRKNRRPAPGVYRCSVCGGWHVGNSDR